MSSTFVLPHHANKETLQQMLNKFRGRLTSKPDSPQLAGMFNALQRRTGNNNNAHHFMIYWPLKPEAFESKRCLYESQTSALIPAPKDFHFVYITSLLAKLHPTKKTHFKRCQCKDHSRRVRLDWSEFVYPQFVELLFNRSMTPSKCPSPIGLHTVQLVNESLQCRFEIDKQATFLTHVNDEVFRLPCRQLYERHKNSHLTVFGSENIEKEHHFAGRRVTSSGYKLQFVVSETKIRASHMKGGGHLMLRKTAEPYVLIVSNFHFLPPCDDGATHYNFYTQQNQHHHHYQLTTHTKKRIKSSKFCAHNTPCMIVSTSPLTIEFKEGAGGWFTLYSPGECVVNLKDECYLELWNKDPGKNGWPLCYEVNDDIMKRDYPGSEVRYFSRLHARYHNLFTYPAFERYDMCAPAHGYVTMIVEEEVYLTEKGEGAVRSTYRDEQFSLNQYATMILPTPLDDSVVMRSASYREVQSIRTYIKHDIMYFFASNGEALTVTDVTYRLGGSAGTGRGAPYKMNALRRPGEGTPFVYFYVNREKTFILFIPIH